MGIGISVFLIAAGAILTFALNVTASGVNLDVVGWILMAVGAIGLVWALVVAARARTSREQVVYRDDDVRGERTVRHTHVR